MPWLVAKGLLPGRGIPAGLVGKLGAASAGFESAGAASDTSGSAAFAARPGFGAGSEVGSAASAVSAVAAADLVFATFFGASGAGLASGNASRNFLATGGVIVDEPLFTNSPSSASFASATLESIPSSLAMSYTRGSAT
jgi:hypothetical protein